MRPVHSVVAANVVDEVDENARWSDLGVPSDDIAEWRAHGFGPFESALARGDGFTPVTAMHCRRQIRRTARTWVNQGLDSLEGLRWHQAGLTATDASRWRSQGVDVATARTRRDGYGQSSPSTDHVNAHDHQTGRRRWGKDRQTGQRR